MNSKEIQLQVDPSTVYAVPLPEVQPYQSQQNQQQQQQSQLGIFRLEFLPPGCCVECWQCCVCCWFLPQPQPEARNSYMIEIDGAEMGKIRQGQSSSYTLTPGVHMLKIKMTGVGGFLRSMVGAESAYSCHINIAPAQTVQYEMGFVVTKCGRKRERHILFCRPAAT